MSEQTDLQRAGTAAWTAEDMESVACISCGCAAATPVVSARDSDPNGPSTLRFQVVRCRECGLQFLNPRPTPEQLKAFYPEHYYAYENTDPIPMSRYQLFWEHLNWWTKIGLRRAFCNYPCPGGEHERWMLRLILWPLWVRTVLLGLDFKILPYRGRGRLLEIGCGTGSGLDYQRLYGFTVTGVEPSASATHVAQTRYKLDVRVGTLPDAKFPDGSFDVVHMSHVFEHLPAPHDTLHDIRRVLDDRGVLVLKLPNIDSISARRFGSWWLGLDLPRHLYHFTPESLGPLLEQHGFAIEAIRHDIGSWGFWRESRRIRARGQGTPLREAWWHTSRDQMMEVWSCWQRRGSNIVVYARKH